MKCPHFHLTIHFQSERVAPLSVGAFVVKQLRRQEVRSLAAVLSQHYLCLPQFWFLRWLVVGLAPHPLLFLDLVEDHCYEYLQIRLF